MLKKGKKNSAAEMPVPNEKVKKVNKTEMVVLDDKTKQKLLEIQKTCNDLTSRYQLILETFLNARELTGKWQISGDTSVLIKVEANEPAVSPQPTSLAKEKPDTK